MNVLLIRPVLIENADDVVAVYGRHAPPDGRGASWGLSYPEYTELRDLNRTFSDLAAVATEHVGLADDGVTRRVRTDFVSANFFRTLGVPVARGREFTVAEEGSRNAAVAVVSHAFWVRRNRDPDMLGSVFQINGESVAVIGIAAEGFSGHNPVSPEVWLPLGLVERFGGGGLQGARPRLDDRDNRALATLLGRIDDGVSRDNVDTDLAALAERLHAQYPAADGTRPRYVAAPLARFGMGNAPDGDEDNVFVAILATVLLGVSGVVLLIACINLANMFLARGAGRRTEIAIRQALGSGRLRLVRQFLVEGLLLALAGGAAGLFAAYWAVSGLLSSMPTTVVIGVLQPETLDVRPGPFVLTTTLLSCVVATLLFSLGPAWRISGDVAATLKESAGGTSRLRAVERARCSRRATC